MQYYFEEDVHLFLLYLLFIHLKESSRIEVYAIRSLLKSRGILSKYINSSCIFPYS